MKSATLTIGQLAKFADVHVETVRYYQRRGLLPVPQRGLGTVRRYDHTDGERLRFIKRAQAMGFTLADAAQLLQLTAQPSCRSARALAADKLELVEAQITELSKWRDELRHWVAGCDANAQDATCPGLTRLG